MMKPFILLSFFLFILIPAKGQSIYEAPENQSFENVLYKISANGDSLLLDIYLPQVKIENKKFPVLIIIYGGGWVGGDKSLREVYYLESLLKSSLINEFAVVSINYSLVSGTVHFPDPVIDCKDAVRWVKANAEKYEFDTGNIGLWGASAGSQLSMLVGYTSDDIWVGDPVLQNYSAKSKLYHQ